MGNDILLFADVDASLHTITSTLSSITDLSSSLDTIALMSQRILVDAEEIRMKKEKLDKIHREAEAAKIDFKLKVNEMNERGRVLDKREQDLREREDRLRVTMMKVEAREIKVSEREKKVTIIENTPKGSKQLAVARMREEAERRIQDNIDNTPNLVKLNIAGGAKFTIEKSNIGKFPHSVFALMMESGRYHDQREIFIDRDPTFFPSVINFMRGSLRPQDANRSVLPLIAAEQKFYLHDGIHIVPFADQIYAWLPKILIPLYNGSRDGLSASAFHALCDKKGPTLTIIKSRRGGYMFGGYNASSWDSPSQPTPKHDSSSFIFTLSNPHAIPPTKYHLIPSKASIWQSTKNNHEIVFGGDGSYVDFSIYPDFKNVYIDFPMSYADTTKKGRNTFTGSTYSAVEDIFVFSVQ